MKTFISAFIFSALLALTPYQASAQEADAASEQSKFDALKNPVKVQTRFSWIL